MLSKYDAPWGKKMLIEVGFMDSGEFRVVSSVDVEVFIGPNPETICFPETYEWLLITHFRVGGHLEKLTDPVRIGRATIMTFYPGSFVIEFGDNSILVEHAAQQVKAERERWLQALR